MPHSSASAMRPRDWAAAGLLLLGLAVLLRSARYTDPLYGLDEQFYVVAGRRLLEGATPYVDLFDRKPVGLFALFAVLATIPADPLLVAKSAATLAAAAGALLVALLAAPMATRAAAVLAGIWYLVLLGMLGGTVGQSPVFYNPLVAGAALLALGTEAELRRGVDRRRALAAMALAGLAVQVKPLAVFEATAIGAWLFFRAARVRGVGRSLGAAAALGAAALLPTLLVAAFFTWTGRLDAWWFATMQSQGLKAGAFAPSSLARLPTLLWGLAAPMALAVAGATLSKRGERLTLLLGWAGATLTEAFAIGQFHPHYASPFALPASVLAAPLFARGRIGALALLAVAAVPMTRQVVGARAEAAIASRAYARVTAALPADTATRCLFIYGAPMSYYLHGRTCTVTPYLFIDQLGAAVEANALPIPATMALARALARRPGTVLTVSHAEWTERNRANDALLARTLARGYHPVATIPHGWGGIDPTPLVVWRRADLPWRENAVPQPAARSNAHAPFSAARFPIVTPDSPVLRIALKQRDLRQFDDFRRRRTVVRLFLASPSEHRLHRRRPAGKPGGSFIRAESRLQSLNVPAHPRSVG